MLSLVKTVYSLGITLLQVKGGKKLVCSSDSYVRLVYFVLIFKMKNLFLLMLNSNKEKLSFCSNETSSE